MAGADQPPHDNQPTRRVDPDNYPTVPGLAGGQVVLGRFLLQRLLGQGGMGVVWLARDQSLGDVVALKFVSELVKRDAAAVDDLKSETRKARQLTHSHIVRIHEFWEDAHAAAVSMEFVDGRNLSQLRLKQAGKVFDPDTLAPWVGQLCAALDYAHQKARLVHRDLKPANLMIDALGDLKVADFGISAAISETTTRVSKRVSSGFTETYASPQQLRGKRPTPADDIYSLGATLYELLTGKPPFYRGNIVLQVEEEAPAPMTERRVELGTTGAPIPKNWEETILACLAKEPKDRPQSAGEVAARLGLTEKNTRNMVGRVVPDEPRSTPKSKLPLYLGLTAAAIIAVLAVLFWPKGEQKPVGSALVAGPRSDPGAAATLSPPRTERAESAPGLPSVALAKDGGHAPPTAALPREFTVTVDPADVGAHLWLGPQSDVVVTAGRAVLKDLPDGEQELIVQATGYQPFTTRVTVKEGRGSAEARLVPVRGALEITARPGTVVTAVDASGKSTQVGTVPANGRLTSENLLTIGAYTLKLAHPDLAPVEQPGVELVIGRLIKVNPAQTPLPGELRIFSVPSGAEVRIDGNVAGATPATLRNQPSEQALRIEVFQRGYRRAEQSVTLKPKEVRTVNLGTLAAESGGINLRFTISDLRFDQAKLTIDGKDAGAAATPPRNATLTLDGLEVGARNLAFMHPDYEPWSQTVTVRDQQTTTIDVPLQPKPGRLGRRVEGERFKDGKVELPASHFLNDDSVAEKNADGALPKVPEEEPRSDSTKALSSAMKQNMDAWAAARKQSETQKPKTYTTGQTGYGGGTSQGYSGGTSLVAAQAEPIKEDLPSPDRRSQATVAKPQPGQPYENSLGMKFVPVPGTNVLFSIWETRVQDYLAFTQATRREWSKSGESAHPAVNVSWDDAQAFCAWLTQKEQTAGRLGPDQKYRLPTDAEWSLAVGLNEAAGGMPQSKDGQIKGVYPWGTQWPPPKGAGNYEQSLAVDSFTGTAPVGSFAANRHGIYDLGGNAWEWCDDYYDGKSTSRVLRGASFYYLLYADLLLSSSRSDSTSDGRLGYIGFRVVVVVGGASSEQTRVIRNQPLVQTHSPQPSQPWTVPDLDLVMQPIAPGTFTMGGTMGDGNEAHQVTLTQAFWLGRTEVTQREWQAVMGSNPSDFKDDDRPVEKVSWTEAMEFCRKLMERERTAGRLPEGYAYTLPTEAQWEYACRAGTTGDYAGNLDSMGWYHNNSGSTTHPVGQKQANAWGLADMHGNIWEWCADWYGNYPGGSETDPTGAPRGSVRVIRGGSWYNPAGECRSANRLWDEPDHPGHLLGFRLALAPSSR